MPTYDLFDKNSSIVITVSAETEDGAYSEVMNQLGVCVDRFRIEEVDKEMN